MGLDQIKATGLLGQNGQVFLGRHAPKLIPMDFSGLKTGVYDKKIQKIALDECFLT